MNSVPPTQSASALRNIGHSTLRAIANFRDRVPLLWKAITIGVICAFCAFIYFLLTGSFAYRNIGEIKPIFDAGNTVKATENRGRATSATQVPIVVPEERHAHHLAEFILSPSSEFQHIGPVSIRLKGAHPALKTCDLVLKISNGHEWNQTGRVNQPVPLVRGARSTQLVITEVRANSVSAYISEARSSSR
jgi:hypothetical protein